MATVKTLVDGANEYVVFLEKSGKAKASTIGTVKRTLDLLKKEMGEEKEIGKILSVHVDSFYKSETATMQQCKDGLRPRAEASILQIRRIVRAALVWWKDQGYTDRLQLQADEKAVHEKHQHAAEKKAVKAERKAKKGQQVERLPVDPTEVENTEGFDSSTGEGA